MYTTLLPLRQTPPEDFESVPVRTVPFAEVYFPDDRASQLQPGFLHVLQALLRSVQPGYILFATAVFYEPVQAAAYPAESFVSILYGLYTSFFHNKKHIPVFHDT